jgi:uncharacterized protein
MGMCGPVLTAISLNSKDHKIGLFAQYHFGRIVTYSLLGAIVGGVGSLGMVAGRLTQIQNALMFISGLFIILMGISLLGYLPFSNLLEKRGLFKKQINRYLKHLNSSKSSPFYFVSGLILGLLPCGIVYTALISAARIGMEGSTMVEGGFKGAALMLSFGLGTFPALLTYSKLSNFISQKFRRHIYKVSAFILVTTGILFIVRGL